MFVHIEAAMLIAASQPKLEIKANLESSITRKPTVNVSEVAITGRHDCDLDRLARDLKRMTQHQIHLFGGVPPMKRYVFLVTALGEGFGGLEHRASTTLVCSRYDLPRAGARPQDDRYLTFLGLASHEYFHTWNVKRIKAAAFAPYDLTRENYTRLLWAFEGITSYYDDLMLVGCGLMRREQARWR